MTVFKWIVRVILVLALLFVGAFTEFYLPTTRVVKVTGTDVKRMDDGGDRPGDDGIAIRTRDVRFINTVKSNGKVLVYRNEDTGWGWPPYFKFNSADYTARATDIIKSDKQVHVAVTSYGWRFPLLSMFPNLTAMRVVPADYTHIPWFNIIFLTVLALLIFFGVRGFRRFLERLRLDERWDAGTAPLDNIWEWLKAERATWKKKPKRTSFRR